jgi:hypothetical protein
LSLCASFFAFPPQKSPSLVVLFPALEDEGENDDEKMGKWDFDNSTIFRARQK